jgi:CopG family transcriptional regulator / antitoxin EndoAI
MPAKKAVKSARTTKASAVRPRRSKVYTISLPPELAARAEAIARAESRTMSEVFRETFRAYESQRILRTLREAAAFGATRDLGRYSEDDVPGMVKEARAAMRAERGRKMRKAG